MTDIRKAAEAALEALDSICDDLIEGDETSALQVARGYGASVRTALRAALEAQPEPMAWWRRQDGRVVLTTCPPDDDGWAPLYAAPQPPAPEWPCYCDEKGIGQPGVTCGDCPRDYGHKVAPAPADHAVSGASAPVGLPAGEQTGPVAEAPTHLPAPADPHAALDRMTADAERLGLYDEPAEVPLLVSMPEPGHWGLFLETQMRAYAAACVAAERERCARIADEHARRNYPWGSENTDRYHAQADWAERIAAVIRRA